MSLIEWIKFSNLNSQKEFKFPNIVQISWDIFDIINYSKETNNIEVLYNDIKDFPIKYLFRNIKHLNNKQLKDFFQFFSTKDNNEICITFDKVTTYWQFIKIIRFNSNSLKDELVFKTLKELYFLSQENSDFNDTLYDFLSWIKTDIIVKFFLKLDEVKKEEIFKKLINYQHERLSKEKKEEILEKLNLKDT